MKSYTPIQTEIGTVATTNTVAWWTNHASPWSVFWEVCDTSLRWSQRADPSVRLSKGKLSIVTCSPLLASAHHGSDDSPRTSLSFSSSPTLIYLSCLIKRVGTPTLTLFSLFLLITDMVNVPDMAGRRSVYVLWREVQRAAYEDSWANRFLFSSHR